MAQNSFFTLSDFKNIYPTDESCLQKIFDLKYGNVSLCPHCEKPTSFNRILTRKSWQCRLCYGQIYPTAGTVFEKSRTPLTEWFYAIYLFSTSKQGVGGKAFQRHIGMGYKTAWRILNKIREVLYQDDLLTLKGVVEVDEAYLCAGTRWSRWGSVSTRKTPIIGLIERGGKVIVKPIFDRKRETIHKIINERVEAGSTIFTDGFVGYKKLSKKYSHAFVNHSEREYVREDVHTNNIENFWGRLKKGVRASHRSVSEKYAAEYCNELVFRHNNKALTYGELFDEILKRCVKING